jgi:hypothetical protein
VRDLEIEIPNQSNTSSLILKTKKRKHAEKLYIARWEIIRDGIKVESLIANTITNTAQAECLSNDVRFWDLRSINHEFFIRASFPCTIINRWGLDESTYGWCHNEGRVSCIYKTALKRQTRIFRFKCSVFCLPLKAIILKTTVFKILRLFSPEPRGLCLYHQHQVLSSKLYVLYACIWRQLNGFERGLTKETSRFKKEVLRDDFFIGWFLDDEACEGGWWE